MTYIYLVTNCYNNSGSVYIGKTTQQRERKAKHKQTYGETIEFTIIDQVDSFERTAWKPLENYWIEQFIQWGFNVQNKNVGGNGPTHLTPEQREHLRVKLTGRKWGPCTPERAAKVSRANAGRPKPDGFGANHSAKLKGIPNPGVSAKLGKPVIQQDKTSVENIKVWNCQTAAALSLGKNSTAAISECCNGKRKSAYGFKWVWLPE
jgi:hypothetical protein